MHVLTSVAADVAFLPPVKQGECGMPAPILLKRLGSRSPITFDPPVQITCPMLRALDRWTKESLQKASRSTLGATVSRILGASGYVCRNTYNRPDGNLSQHASGNAIDLSAFVLRDGRIVTLRKGWGPTHRDLEKLRKSGDAARKVKPALEKGQELRGPVIAAGPPITRTKLTPQDKPALPPRSGPTRIDEARQKMAAPAARFLRAVRRGACRRFATTLSPEADEVHRSHFHLDLNAAREQPYCK